MSNLPNHSGLQRVHQWLHAPVASDSLVLMRAAIGGLLLWLVIHFYTSGNIGRLYLEQTLHFKYPFLGWVPDPTPGLMNGALIAVGVSAVLVALGLLYRIATVVIFVSWSYIFFCDQTAYQNHDYLMVLLTGMLCVMPLNRRFSLDTRMGLARYSETVSMWCLFLFRFQIGLVYFWGGVRKINPDWLRGEPIRSMLHTEAFEHPVVGGWLLSETTAIAFAYGGLLFDLLIVPALLWRRTRIPAYVVAVCFHLTNAWMWDIDVFPWFMIVATLLFFDPAFGRPLLNRLRDRFGTAAAEVGGAGSELHGDFRRRKMVSAAVVTFCAIQMLVPCRPFLHAGHPLEQQDLLMFSWNMMLRLNTTRLAFRMVDNDTGEAQIVQPNEFLSTFQTGRLGSPDMMHQAAQYVAEVYSESGTKDVSVYVLAEQRVHARDWQVAYDPSVDFAATPRSIGPKPWVAPFANRYPPDPARRTAFTRAKWEFCQEQGYLPFTKAGLDVGAADHVRRWEEAYRRAMLESR